MKARCHIDIVIYFTRGMKSVRKKYSCFRTLASIMLIILKISALTYKTYYSNLIITTLTILNSKLERFGKLLRIMQKCISMLASINP